MYQMRVIPVSIIPANKSIVYASVTTMKNKTLLLDSLDTMTHGEQNTLTDSTTYMLAAGIVGVI